LGLDEEFKVEKILIPEADDFTAQDNLAFTLGWFEKFPEYKKNELYLTGESFAGNYIFLLCLVVY